MNIEKELELYEDLQSQYNNWRRKAEDIKTFLLCQLEEFLISGILEFQIKTIYTSKKLEMKSIRLLDNIYDNID